MTFVENIKSFAEKVSSDIKSLYDGKADKEDFDKLSSTFQNVKAELKGDPGPQGNPGANGKDGNSLLVSQFQPRDSDGNDGDICLDSGTGSLYEKKGGYWEKQGNLQGPKGEIGQSGTSGKDGKSAYEIWLEEGHTGSKQDFLNSLQVSSTEIDNKFRTILDKLKDINSKL